MQKVNLYNWDSEPTGFLVIGPTEPCCTFTELMDTFKASVTLIVNLW